MEFMKIFEFERLNLRDAVVIDGFPSVGLVSTITANYMINTMELRQIGIVESPSFPALSIVRNAEPLSPVRIYAGEKKCENNPNGDQVVVFVSEFVPPPHLTKQIATTILEWFKDNKCKLLITPEGLVANSEMLDGAAEEVPQEGEEYSGIPEGAGEGPENASGIGEELGSVSLDLGENVQPPGEEGEREIRTYAVGSTPGVRELLEKYEIDPLQNGAITGVAGVLLTEAKRLELDVVCLLAEAHKDFPDARAAGKIIEIMDKLLDISIDPSPLYAEAETIETQIKLMRKQAMPSVEAQRAASPIMYG